MKFRSSLFTLAILFIVSLTSACNSSNITTGHTRQMPVTNTLASAQFSTAASVSTNAAITTSITCPASQTGRAAVMPPLHLGTTQNIVYISNTPDEGRGSSGGGLFFIKRYNLNTKTSSVILNINPYLGRYWGTLYTAQISLDGQWILFNSLINNRSEIQLIRLDGRYLQTLYCAPSGQQIDPTHTTGMQWSPNQKQIIFNQAPSVSAAQSLFLLQTSSGKLQQIHLVSTPASFQLLARTWADNNRVFIVDIGSDIVRLLDTSKGTVQNFNSLQYFVGFHDFVMDFDSNYDATKFYMSTFMQQGGAQCEIYIRPLIINKNIQFLSCNKLPTDGIRVIGKGSSSLLLSVDDQNRSRTHSLWKINANGTGLTRLTHSASSYWNTFCTFSQYPSSNFSNNGLFYTTGDSFGSLNGGPLTRYTTNNNMRLVGWANL